MDYMATKQHIHAAIDHDWKIGPAAEY